jgi:mercuric ion transport protein
MSELSSTGRESSVSWLALFASASTLVCCALPIALVSLGMGATITALTSTFPFLVTLSEHRLWVFLIPGVLLAFGAWSLWPGRACPIDFALATKCEQATLLLLALPIMTTTAIAASNKVGVAPIPWTPDPMRVMQT